MRAETYGRLDEMMYVLRPLGGDIHLLVHLIQEYGADSYLVGISDELTGDRQPNHYDLMISKSDGSLVGLELLTLTAAHAEPHEEGTAGNEPPPNAEYLFYFFLPPKDADALVGDLEERYKLIHAKFGKGKANLWYWKQCLASVGPIVWVWAQKVSLKPFVGVLAWAAAKGLLKDHEWLKGAAEVWKRMRS